MTNMKKKLKRKNRNLKETVDTIGTLKSIFAALFDNVMTNNFVNHVHTVIVPTFLSCMGIHPKDIVDIETDYEKQNALLDCNKPVMIRHISIFLSKHISFLLKNNIRITFKSKVTVNSKYDIRDDITGNKISVLDLLTLNGYYAFDTEVDFSNSISSLFDKHDVNVDELSSFYTTVIEPHNKYAPDRSDPLIDLKDLLNNYLEKKIKTPRFILTTSFNRLPTYNNGKSKYDLDLSLDDLEMLKFHYKKNQFDMKYDKQFYIDWIFDNGYMFTRYFGGPALVKVYQGSFQIVNYFEKFITSYKGYVKIKDELDESAVEEIFEDYIYKPRIEYIHVNSR